MAERDDSLIQRYLLGDLEGAERDDFERRLEADERLAEQLASYRAMTAELRSLGDPELPEHLWAERIGPVLTEKLSHEEHHWSAVRATIGRLRAMLLRPAVVVALSVLAIVAVTFLLQQQFVVPEPLDSYDRAIANIQSLRGQLLEELGTLTAEMETRKQLMSVEIRKVYERTLRDIDESIAAAERFYFAYPDDSDAVQFLFAAYQQKVEFIERFKQIEPLEPEA